MSDIFVGNIGDLTTPPQYDANCANNFITEIANEVTGSCMIPMNLPRAEVMNIINRAKKWFYKNYEYSMQENFLVVPKEVFDTDYFKRKRAITLPGPSTTTGGNEIYSVYGVAEVGSRYGAGSSITFTTGDFDIQRALFGSLYSGGSSIVSGAENLQYYVINESFFDLARQILENPISFNYSQQTHELKFTGQNPTNHVILEVYETIPDCALFGDEAFFRYVAAKVKISLGQKLSIFGYNLPGNITINADAIQSMGNDELSAVIEEIKNDEGTDWMMHS